MKDSDTIAAISTPVGEGGIGIVRLSGDTSLKVAERIFTSSKGDSPLDYYTHSIHHGYIKVPGSGEPVDEVLLSVMRAPATYTAEDVVEINCHGGVVPLRRILDLCLSEGARLAEPGEFTKRAYLNGRIDLAQAEAVLDIISSESDAAGKAAVEQLRGGFSRKITEIRSSVIEILSEIELALDFTEEDVLFSSVDKMTRGVEEARKTLIKILETADRGIVLRKGARAVICGRPNVGKSSLMNAFLRHDRVIVTPVAGTTRDVVEESINISGLSVRLSDTAGIVGTSDPIEAEGIRRSKEKLKEADIVMFMVDASRPLSDEDDRIYDIIKDKEVIIVLNKTDLPGEFDVKEVNERFGWHEVIEVSATRGTGLVELEDAAYKTIFKGDVRIPDGPLVTNLRHKKALEKALEIMDKALKVTGSNYSAELLASDLRQVLHHLGQVTGETVEDDILDRIFSRFCIGK